MPTQDENREALMQEVMRHAPGTLDKSELLAALAFAMDVEVFEPGHPFDRMIRTPLDDPKFQETIFVSSAEHVRALAQSLAAKGVLEPVEERNTWRIAHLDHLPERGGKGKKA
jgi:hypothetical protein